MRKFLRKYPQALLITLALFFLAVIVISFTWGIGQVVSEVDRAVNTQGSENSSVNFDLKGAAALDLRGLVK